MEPTRFVRSTFCIALLASLPALAQTAPTAAQRATVPVLDGNPRQIVPGVYSLGELAPVFAYLIEAEDGLVLIDTGYNGQLDRLAQAIVSLGFDPNDIAHILVTHFHLDHWMNMDWIRSMTGARTYMGSADAAVIERGPSVDLVVPARVTPPGLRVPEAHVDYPIDGRHRLPVPGLDLEAIPCAGHTQGSVCYLLETGPWRILFGGDAIMSVRSGLGTYTTRLHPRYGGNIAAYRETLTRLTAVPVNLVLPGHPYVDRRATGNHPHPVVSATGWQATLRAGIEELARIERRYLEDGFDFLDEEPRRVAPSLYYLGTQSGQAAYAFTAGERVCLVDPWRLSPATLQDRLSSLGLEHWRIESILLTEPRRLDGPSPFDVVPAIGPITYGPEAAPRSPPALGTPNFIPIGKRRAISVCGFEVEALPTVTWRPGFVSYLLPLSDKLVAFTGDAVAPLSADDQIVAPPAATAPGNVFPTVDTLHDLDAAAVDIWLPSRPFAAQNANLYDDRWHDTLRINRLALEHARLSPR